jgi:hypothetical protein
MKPARNRIVYLISVAIVMVLGLSSRKYAGYLPEYINTYLGDALWAVMIYLFAALLLKNRKPSLIALLSLSFCYLNEISQLYHAPWIDAIRNTRLGGLVLGFGFLWSDIIAYTMGIGVILAIESVYFWSKERKD